MEIIVRKGNRDDLPVVYELIKELADYERAPSEVSITLEDLERDGFGDRPVYSLLVATVADMIAGMAIYYTKYSTWKGRGIYVEDIIVKQAYRNQGIGRELFDEIIKEAKSTGTRQIHWQVLDWNEPAIAFYEKYHASFDHEWINCKMNADQIRKYKAVI